MLDTRLLRAVLTAAGLTVAVALIAPAASVEAQQPATPAASAPAPAPVDLATRFAQRVALYEAGDKATPPPTGAILLAGDSQFDRWKTFQEDLAGYTVINRGIDSFRTSDLIQYADRLVIQYKPRLVVLHVGGNDLHGGKTPEQLLADTKTLIAKIRAGLPGVPIVWSSTTPGPARWDEREKRTAANALVKQWIAGEKNLSFVDLWSAMLTPDGQAREDIWVADRVHPNHEGYLIRVRLTKPLLGPPDKPAAAAPTGPSGFAASSPLKFRAQDIATDFGVGYAVTAADVNGDKQTDILAISGTELVWFKAPTWEKQTILGAGATIADNVTLAPHDIDDDGRLDIALGAGWTGPNTGTLQWVRQNPPRTTPAWEVFPIGAEPTLHRIKWADVDGDRKAELIVAPLHGPGAKGPAWDGPSAKLMVFRVSKDPAREPWPMELAGEVNHIQHNFLVVNADRDPQDELITASKEGLQLWKRATSGSLGRTLIGEGAPGEVKLGRVGGRRMLATVEPWHGAGVAVYAEPVGGAGTWSKTTIETGLTEGHALGWADFDGDGSDELAVGWRRGKPGLAIYVVDRDGRLTSKTLIDDGGIDCEDLIVGDFNGDRKPDIVASGRATKNIRIYWNETVAAKKK